MARTVLLPLRQSGIALIDLGLRLYERSSPQDTSGITLSERAGGDYVLGGLPDGDVGEWWTLTWEYQGFGGAYRWPSQPGQIPGFILPAREAGLNSASFGFVVYRDREAEPWTATVEEVGAPGDYWVSGLPEPSGAEVQVTWEYPSGFVQSLVYPLVTYLGGGAGSGFDWFEGQIYSHIAAWLPFSGPIVGRVGTTYPPPAIAPENGTYTPKIGAPYMELHTLWVVRNQHGNTYAAEGIWQFDVFVERGLGTVYLNRALDLVQPMMKSAAVPGLHVETATPPMTSDAPEGWYGKRVDLPFRWYWERP